MIDAERGVDGFCVVHKSTCYWVEFEQQSLVAIVRWMASGATGAFSAFDLEKDVMLKAGLTYQGYYSGLTYQGDYAVPIEFRDTELVDRLEAVDFPDVLDETKDTSELLAHHQELASGSQVEDGGSYFISDVDSDFQFTLIGNKVEMRGTPLRYSWRPTTGSYVRITRVVPFLDEKAAATWFSDQLAFGREILQAQIDAAEAGSASENFWKQTLADLETRLKSNDFELQAQKLELKLSQNNNLFRKTALLRTIHKGNPTAWKAFLEEITEEYADVIAERIKHEGSFSGE